MKKSLFAWAVLLPVAVLSVLTACEKEETKVSVGIKADAAFTEEGLANITVTLSATPQNEVTVTLAVSSEGQSGSTAIGADHLTFNNTVTLSGVSSATVPVKADLSSLDDSYQAVITIASAEGATIDMAASTVYIQAPQSVSQQVSGADGWKISGDFGEIDLARTSGDPETWAVENAWFGGSFQFVGSKGGSALVLGSSAKITLGSETALVKDGASLGLEEGSYTITLYPSDLKVVIAQGSSQVHTLNWKVEYQGQQWVEGFETEGQLDVFEVSGTDTKKYYMAYYSSLGYDDYDDEYTMESYGESLEKDPEAFFAQMQENIDATIEYYEEYGYTLEDFLYDYAYNEEVDGTTLLYYGQPAGDYEFLVLSMDGKGQLDQGYKYITFTKDTDPETQYDWDIVAHIREDWTGAFSEWVDGYEGQYFWIDGRAPGAAYTIIDIYTDGEIDWFLNGELKNFIGNTNANIQAYLNAGYTPDEVFGYLGAAVDEDGYFSDYVSTYNIEGEANLLILGFDKDGQLINTSTYSNGADMGKVVIDMPVYVPEPLDLTLNENWGAEFVGTYYDEEYGMDLSVIKITGLKEGEYVGAGLYGAGYIDEDNLSDLVRYAVSGVVDTYEYYSWYYDDITLADVANTAEYPWLFYSIDEEAYGEWDVLIAGVSEDFEATGEYAIATITLDGTRLDSDPTLVARKVRSGKADLNKASLKKQPHVAKTAPADRSRMASTKRADRKKAARKPLSIKSAAARLPR